MAKDSALTKARKQMMTAGLSEHEILADGGGAASIHESLQELQLEKNQAKREAMRAIDEKYAEPLASLERRYAMMVKLSARSSAK